MDHLQPKNTHLQVLRGEERAARELTHYHFIEKRGRQAQIVRQIANRHHPVVQEQRPITSERKQDDDETAEGEVQHDR